MGPIWRQDGWHLGTLCHSAKATSRPRVVQVEIHNLHGPEQRTLSEQCAVLVHQHWSQVQVKMLPLFRDNVRTSATGSCETPELPRELGEQSEKKFCLDGLSEALPEGRGGFTLRGPFLKI